MPTHTKERYWSAYLEVEVGQVDEQEEDGGSSRNDLQAVNGICIEAVQTQFHFHARVNGGNDCPINGRIVVHAARVRLGAVVCSRNNEG